MSSIQNGGAGPSGKYLADHVLWFWSYRADILDQSKKALNATVQAELLLLRGTGTKPEHATGSFLISPCGDMRVE